MSNVSFPAYSTFAQTKAAGSPPAGEPKVADKGQAPAIEQGVSGFRQTLEAAEAAALNTAVSGADPHAMVDALAQAEIALSTAVTVRDKVVEAYNELLRMPV